MDTKERQIYEKAVISHKIHLNINQIHKNLRKTLEDTLKLEVEGKCIVDGYVKRNSVNLLSYSSGLVRAHMATFVVTFECLICCPVANMYIKCVAKVITKAGITAESFDESPSPFVLYVSRDQSYNSQLFNAIKENDKFVARVIEQRFELNDPHISIIAEVADTI